MELADADLAAGLAARALEAGVLVNVAAGTVVRFIPALTIPEDELWEGIDKVLALVA
jgi:acetylornithine/succinyldiaminopimelate/putrescine aminotransferase